jgi:hypothetical protein
MAKAYGYAGKRKDTYKSEQVTINIVLNVCDTCQNEFFF